MKQKKSTVLTAVIVLMVVVVGFLFTKGYKKTSISSLTDLSKSTPTSDANHGDRLFKQLFSDTKYGFSFKLPDYFGRYGGWESDNAWEKDANPDHLSILPLETAKQEDVVFKQLGLLKEISISVSKNTTIDKWAGKTRTVFNSQADGWGLDHKFITQKFDTNNKKFNTLKFTYLDQVLMPENPQAGDEYDKSQPVTGVAFQIGTNVLVISMKHGINNQTEVDSLFTQVISTFNINK